MRRISLLLALMLCHILVNGQDRKVTLNLNKTSISSVFKQIEAESGYTFIYSDDIVSDSIKVNVNVVKIPVSEVLYNLLSPHQLFYQLLSEKMIVIGSRNLLMAAESAGIKSSLLGNVINSESNAVPYATIALLEDSVQVNGAIANSQGNFQFLHALKINHPYVLKISSLGYETAKINFIPNESNANTKAFGRIQLSSATKNLKEINVVASQKLIEMNEGNIVFNVSKSMTAQGSNALELLSRAPGVTVSTGNTISLNGKSGAAVLIDGKQTYLSGSEIAELLKSMSSSDIKSIEIISSPGVKYDASGTAGIINVKTLKSQIQGFNMGLTSGLSYGVYLRNNQDLSFSYRKNKLNVLEITIIFLAITLIYMALIGFRRVIFLTVLPTI